MNGELSCEVVGDELVIRVPVSALAKATEIMLPDLLMIDPDLVEVTDPLEWAEAVVDALTEEEEDGTTRINRMFDDAFKHASEQGAEGIEIEGA
ncbi:hypothetical protein [Cupriavidus basilensis]|uniref:Uncharacterized protein n=1 Tax=Cupriavidus basilensis TaxID=68895 RepID=A0A643G565_9BURK|nr:hypothetical protein [Cupriavidus basilensis]QOT75070.1 hypothetical protein F7R26_012535 [Cupriavidus basilensis]